MWQLVEAQKIWRCNCCTDFFPEGSKYWHYGNPHKNICLKCNQVCPDSIKCEVYNDV